MSVSGVGNTVSAALTEAENWLVDEIEAWLMESDPGESRMVAETFSRLRTLGDAVFAYPSIRQTKLFRGVVFDKSHLIESMLEFSSSSQLLRIPTKVVAIRSFLVAKFHAFSLLSSLTAARPDYNAEVRKTVFSVISTLITESVYFSCMDDPYFSRETKASFAGDLIDLWDSGTDLRGLRHLSALSSLWLARNSNPPIFGTMDGNSELLRLTIELDEDWRRFIIVEAENDQTRWALEEFMFGLPWEEIEGIRAQLVLSGINAIGDEGGKGSSFSMINKEDPRTFYDFFIERRDACILRKKLAVPGPKYTLEEIYLKYRIITEIR